MHAASPPRPLHTSVPDSNSSTHRPTHREVPPLVVEREGRPSFLCCRQELCYPSMLSDRCTVRSTGRLEARSSGINRSLIRIRSRSSINALTRLRLPYRLQWIFNTMFMRVCTPLLRQWNRLVLQSSRVRIRKRIVIQMDGHVVCKWIIRVP